MRIGINLLYLTSNTNSGVGKHTEALLNGFRSIQLLSSCYLFVRQCYYEKAKAEYPEATVILIQAHKLANFYIQHKKRHSNFTECHYLNCFVINSEANKQAIDVMFYPFNDSTICFPKGIPNIFVIRDLYYQRYSEYYGRFHYLYAKKKHNYFLKHCNCIVTGSEVMKKEIMLLSKSASTSTIQVIPNAIETAKKFTSFTPVDEPYILCIAPQTYYKNVITLLRAFNLVKRKIPHQLILIGDHNDMTHEIQSYIKDYDLSDRILCLHNIPDEHRNTLYRNASLLVTPSLSERSGRVPIEAALLRTPVITTRSGVLPEITLGLLPYYEPTTDSRALAMKMMDLLRYPPSDEVREQIAATYERLYNENTIANKYLSLFQSSVNKNKQ